MTNIFCAVKSNLIRGCAVFLPQNTKYTIKAVETGFDTRVTILIKSNVLTGYSHINNAIHSSVTKSFPKC